MSATLHSFWHQKEREAICREIRTVFYQSRGLVQSIEHVPVQFELLAGLDKVMWLHNGTRNTYEDKTDFRAADTTNLFLETWSKKPDDRQGGVRGWGYTCGAQYIDFFLPQHRTILIGETLRVKSLIRKWDADNQFPRGEAVNANFTTVGLRVPVHVVVKEAELKAVEVGEDVARKGVARHVQARASEQLGRIITDSDLVDTVSDLAISTYATIGEPRGSLNGIAYSTVEAFASALNTQTEFERVRERLLTKGEISEECFRQNRMGARLPPNIAALRKLGWRIDNDKEERNYLLISAVPIPVSEDMPLFRKCAT